MIMIFVLYADKIIRQKRQIRLKTLSEIRRKLQEKFRMWNLASGQVSDLKSIFLLIVLHGTNRLKTSSKWSQLKMKVLPLKFRQI